MCGLFFWHLAQIQTHKNPQLHGDPWAFPRVFPDKALTSIQSFPHTLTSVSREVVQGSRSPPIQSHIPSAHRLLKQPVGESKWQKLAIQQKHEGGPTSGWWFLWETYLRHPTSNISLEMFIFQVARLIWIHRFLGASSTSILVLWDINQPQLELYPG